MRRMGNTRNVFWPEATGVAVCEAAAAASLTWPPASGLKLWLTANSDRNACASAAAHQPVDPLGT